MLRHLPDGCRHPGRISAGRLAFGLPLRRGRGTTRQGTRGACAAAVAAEDHRLRHGRIASLQRSAGHEPRGAATSRRRAPPCASAVVGNAAADTATRRPGDPHLYLRHHGQAEGRDAVASQRHPRRARSRFRPTAGGSGRAHLLPAAVPRRRAHRRGVPEPVHRHGAELRREPGNDPGERARDRADGISRRAAHLGEVLFGDHDPPEGGDTASSAGPTPPPSPSASG